MSRAFSPLRYPGGKACLKPILSELITKNSMKRYHYAEPYAGGCGLALALLFGGDVSEIHINDIDPSIWSFWEGILNHTDDFLDLMRSTEVSVNEWYKQREIQHIEDTSDLLKLGFAAFYLNRTNRSGIIKGAGVIGGLKQNGNYKIDCRFNKDKLEERIKRISKYRNRIRLSNKDAVDFMSNCSDLPDKTLFCIDPPYFNKGSSLYTSFYNHDDHKDVADAVSKLKHPWVVTYDDANKIRELYENNKKYLFDIKYSVQTKRIGTELLITSDNVIVPDFIEDRRLSDAILAA